jgi:hypothetical protein
MIGMMMLTFILFLAFVINTGMLVNAKINLQNAADMAAYSGAATQARLLNQISYINYEMRRQYKKFLFRYYVVGNMAQRSFPRAPGGTGPAFWSPDGTVNYNVPAVCMIFNSNDNYCQTEKLPQISIPPNTGPLDQINATLIQQLEQIESIRKENCAQIGFTNTTTLRLWLWNTDPDLRNLQNSVPANLQKHINTIRGLALGIGLVPRQLILRSRIETLKDYINEPPKAALTHSQVVKMQNDTDPSQNERSIQAFLSAFFTLGDHTFPAEDVVMDELMPANILSLDDIKVKFDAYAISFPTDPASAAAGDCTPKIVADSLRQDLTIAVRKNPKKLTYYAVRLKAKAKLLFSPFGTVTLKAYAAAQPFGSRLGPTEKDTDFLRPSELPANLAPDGAATSLTLQNKIPNLPIREQDTAGAGGGWDTKEALGAFYSGFSTQAGEPPKQLDEAAMNRAMQSAMAPNPYESKRFNIPNDVGGDSFVRNFDSRGVLAFWAPVFAPAKAAQADAAIRSLVDELMGDVGAPELKAALQQELSAYFGKLRNGAGENIGGAAESFNVFRMQDPLHVNGNAAQPIAVPGGLSLTDPAKLRTSWNAVLSGDFRKEGRVGYSVKFVSFDSLLRKTSKTDDRENWDNDLAGDSEAQADYTSIQH